MPYKPTAGRVLNSNTGSRPNDDMADNSPGSLKMSRNTASERQTFVDKETGREVSGLMKVVECDRDNFDIVYIMNFCNLFDMIGGKKYQILKYLLQNRNSENQVIITTTELSQALNISRDTVSRTLNILKKYGVITTKTGVIRINPKVIMHGSVKKEDWIFTKFVEEQKKMAKSD